MNSLKTQAARRLALVHELQNCSNTLMSLRQEQTGLDLVHLHVKANVEAIKAEQTGRNLALKEAQNELAGGKFFTSPH